MKPSTSLDRGLLLVRLALGLVFVMHGWQKLTVFGPAGTAAFLAQVHVPVPHVNAFLITGTELLGGLALITGTLTRVAAALLAFSMTVAIATVHIANGFFLPNGYEFALTLLLVNVGLVLTGAGAYAVDAKLFAEPARRTVPALKSAA